MPRHIFSTIQEFFQMFMERLWRFSILWLSIFGTRSRESNYSSLLSSPKSFLFLFLLVWNVSAISVVSVSGFLSTRTRQHPEKLVFEGGHWFSWGQSFLKDGYWCLSDVGCVIFAGGHQSQIIYHRHQQQQLVARRHPDQVFQVRSKSGWWSDNGRLTSSDVAVLPPCVSDVLWAGLEDLPPNLFKFLSHGGCWVDIVDLTSRVDGNFENDCRCEEILICIFFQTPSPSSEESYL